MVPGHFSSLKSEKNKNKKPLALAPPHLYECPRFLWACQPWPQSLEHWSQALHLCPPSLTTSSETNNSWRIPHRQTRCGQAMWSGCGHRRWPKSFLRKPRGLVFPGCEAQPGPARRPCYPSRTASGGNGAPGSPLGWQGQGSSPGGCLPFHDPGLVNR